MALGELLDLRGEPVEPLLTAPELEGERAERELAVDHRLFTGARLRSLRGAP
jgi:hypothetical protein